MKLFALIATALLLPLTAAAAPIASDVWLTLESHPDGGIAAPYYGLRLDGLEGDLSEEYTFDFSDVRSDMRLFYDSAAGTVEITGTSWGGEDIGVSYRNGGNLYEINFTYSAVVDLGNVLEVAPGGGNMGTIKDLNTNITYDMIDVAGSHSYSFRIADSHRGAGPAGWGWVNHSGHSLDTHVYASDWLFVVGEPVPEPSGALLFAAGALVIGRVRGRRFAR